MGLTLIDCGKHFILDQSITKYHSTYSNVTDLPILFVNNYSDINEDLLDSFLNNKDKSLILTN